jgi:hypothetical protein
LQCGLGKGEGEWTSGGGGWGDKWGDEEGRNGVAKCGAEGSNRVLCCSLCLLCTHHTGVPGKVEEPILDTLRFSTT